MESLESDGKPISTFQLPEEHYSEYSIHGPGMDQLEDEEEFE
jgi:hypothetical protein